MNAKHTPGPWTVAEYEDEAYIVDRDGHSAQGITSVKLKGVGMNYSEALANARLIAASPDLLNCVLHVLEASEDNGDMSDISFGMLRDAVAKATHAATTRAEEK